MIGGMKSPILSCAIVLTLSFGALRAVNAGSATWSANPVSGDWNTAENWTPNTVPNSMTDIATFGTSAITQVSLTDTTIDLGSIVFSPGANGFTITGADAGLDFFGEGIINDSDEIQQFALDSNIGISFRNSATAGEATSYSVSGFASIFFYDTSSAGTANFTAANDSAYPAIYFLANSTASNATFNILTGATLFFGPDSVPASGIFMIDGGSMIVQSSAANNGTIFCSHGGQVAFSAFASGDSSTILCSQGGVVSFFGTFAGHAEITADGGTASDNAPGHINMYGGANGDDATFYLEGGAGDRALGATMIMQSVSTAGNAQVFVNGGTSGGQGASIGFLDESNGGTAAFTLSGNAKFDLTEHDPLPVKIGSLAGQGSVFLGSGELWIGKNNLSTTFSGVIQGAGSLTKVGSGILILSNANTYSGGTTVSAGALVTNNQTGSGTGAGAVQINAGTLGGNGIIAGAVTVGTGSGTGAFLETSAGVVKTTSLSIQSGLTFKADSTYTYNLNTIRAKADKLIANGVNIDSGAQFNFVAAGNKTLNVGKKFVAISNTAATPISGTFANLPDGSMFTVGPNTFQVSYEGGDGNDLTLTVTP
jgi:autotransporter-associated beta strand protein